MCTITNLKELKDRYYNEFEGTPFNRPIVRSNQPNDAFALVVLKVLFGQAVDIRKENISEVARYVVAPPDGGIDIFFQHEEGDDSFFDVIQVKYAPLSEDEIRTAIGKMKRTIQDYVKDPKTIKSESLKEILSQSELDKGSKGNCKYYVVHTGDVKDFSGSEEDEKVLTYSDLELLLMSSDADSVKEDSLCIGGAMTYNPKSEDRGLVCSISGYNLAVLNNKYFQTEIGRNLLFGSNLRENLNTRRSGRYQSMEKTIIKCPENFWYFNNGITIIADSFERKNKNVVLKNFSIVNGAQTTSALGLFLKEAQKNGETEKIEKLKRVFVLARILCVVKSGMRQDIAIFNNTQNPITSRDMVANRDEQKYLSKWLLSGKPEIYVEIRRGAKPPASFNKKFSHRKTSNEELAQIAYAVFKKEPFSAKDKKKSLFNNDFSQTDVEINESYQSIFKFVAQDSPENGILFKKTKREIEEALFIQRLYKDAKRYLRNDYMERIETNEKQREKALDDTARERAMMIISKLSIHAEAASVCMFYFLTFYSVLKEQFEAAESEKDFDYNRYYSDSEYKESIIKSIATFVKYTAEILVDTANEAKKNNINNWVRSKHCETKFIERVDAGIVNKQEWEDKFKEFVDKFKR